MDTYVNLNGDYIKIGENSLIGISEEPIIKIVSSISSGKGGSKIIFKKLDDECFNYITSIFKDAELYGKESYAVHIKNDIIIYYTASITKLYALYAIKRHYTKDGIKQGVIYNTPKVDFRCFKSYLPPKHGIDSFKKFIDMLIAFGHNSIMIEVGGAMEYKRHPEISEGWVEYCDIFNEFTGKAFCVQRIMEYPKNAFQLDNCEGKYLTQEEVREIVEYCRARDFEIIPEVPSLSHADYILFKHPEFAEYPNDVLPNNACPLNEDYIKIEMDILDEVIEVFKPKRINICHDEAYVFGLCPKCKGKEARDLFSGHIVRLYTYLEKMGVKTMIWGDGILPIEHGGNECYHRRFPFEGRTVKVYDKTYEVRRFKYLSKQEWSEVEKNEPGAEAWYVPPKSCYERLPRDIEIVNWMWSIGDAPEDMLNDKGFYNVYGNFLATGIKNLNERIKNGVSGFMFSNWGRCDFEHLQRNNGLFAIGFNAYAAWCSEYDERRMKENIFFVADAIYKYMNYDTLMRKHLKITHSTNAIIKHENFIGGNVIVKDDYHIGDYDVVLKDGSVMSIPIHWGHNIGYSGISWDNSEKSEISLEAGGYCVKYLFEPIGISKPISCGNITYYEFVVPIEDEVSSISHKTQEGFDVDFIKFTVAN